MEGPALTDKQRILEVLERQPDDSSYDELLRELAFERMIALSQSAILRPISSCKARRLHRSP